MALVLQSEDEGFLFAREHTRAAATKRVTKEDYPMADDHDGDADRRERV
ncbi:MAG: hypothetical protein ACXWQR_10810 [Ktedonobacterales bacterium]